MMRVECAMAAAPPGAQSVEKKESMIKNKMAATSVPTRTYCTSGRPKGSGSLPRGLSSENFDILIVTPPATFHKHCRRAAHYTK